MKAVAFNKSQYNRDYYWKNRERVLKQKQKYREAHREALSDYSQRYYREHKAECDRRQQLYNRVNRLVQREYFRLRARRKRQSISFRLQCSLQNRIWYALKGKIKSARTIELVGCSIEWLRKFLKRRFAPGMSWKNYGQWHVDHIRPCASFDLSDPEQQKQCFHFTNLQPLWAADNIKKKDNWCVS